MPKYTNAIAFAAAAMGWYYNAGQSRTYVKFAHTGGSTVVKMGPDTVGDGVANSWRDYYFGTPASTDATTCDADGDGMRSIDEYRAGTNPDASNSQFRVAAERPQPVSGTNNVLVSWQSQPGIVYGIDWMNDLSNGSPWQAISSLRTGDGATITWFDNGSETATAPENSPTSRRYYRVTVP